MVKKFLHILYAGKSGGGAQDFAIALAEKTLCITSSVRKGDLYDRFERMNLNFMKVWSEAVKQNENILCSDLKAYLYTIIYCILINKLKRKKINIILHHDKYCILIYKVIIKIVSKMIDGEVYTTTRTQSRAYRKNKFIRVFRNELLTSNFKDSRSPKKNIPKHNHITEKKKEIVLFYVGRSVKWKNINLMIDWIKKTAEKLTKYSFTLHMFSDYKSNYNKFDGNLKIIHHGWCSEEEINMAQLSLAPAFILLFSNKEGISLSLIKGMRNGLVPLIYSENVCHNLYLSNDHLVNGKEFLHFEKIIKNFDRSKIFESILTDSLEFDKFLFY